MYENAAGKHDNLNLGVIMAISFIGLCKIHSETTLESQYKMQHSYLPFAFSKGSKHSLVALEFSLLDAIFLIRNGMMENTVFRRVTLSIILWHTSSMYMQALGWSFYPTR